MIRLQDILQKLADIKGQVEQKVHHPYLLKFIESPHIDEDKLLLLILIMEELNIPYSQMKNYCLTTMLIQIALDTHEHITNNMIKQEEKYELTRRQLTVLAGDYYSGLYYKLLADSEDIIMIKVLAGGIKEVNEHKISLYQKDFEEVDKLMTSIKIIESSLVIKLINYFQADNWTEFAANMLLVKRLLDEKKKYLHSERSPLFEALKTIIFPIKAGKLEDLSLEQQHELLVICDRYIDDAKKVLESAIRNVPGNDLLEERIFAIVNQHHPSAKTFVEEG